MELNWLYVVLGAYVTGMLWEGWCIYSDIRNGKLQETAEKGMRKLGIVMDDERFERALRKGIALGSALRVLTWPVPLVVNSLRKKEEPDGP